MAHRTLADAPTEAELQRLAPVERYVAITRYARDRGTLTKTLAQLRMAALIQALAHAGMTAAALSRIDGVEVTRGRLSLLRKRALADLGQGLDPSES